MGLVIPQNAADGIANVAFVGASAGGDSIDGGVRAGGWDLGVVFLVRNTDAASKTVTVDGKQYVVPATTGFAMVPVHSGVWGKRANITYSAIAGVTIAAVRFA